MYHHEYAEFATEWIRESEVATPNPICLDNYSQARCWHRNQNKSNAYHSYDGVENLYVSLMRVHTICTVQWTRCLILLHNNSYIYLWKWKYTMSHKRAYFCLVD